MENNFKLNKSNIGQKVKLSGWVNKSRRLGELIFIDLRNNNEIVQVIVTSDSKDYELANTIRSEYVITVEGEVVERKDKNPEMYSGDIEIKVSNISIINSAEQTPMIIRDETDALEQKRMEYRYLDIRRSVNQTTLKTRSDFNRTIREYFYENEYTEIETPTITRPTPGGAGELKVLSENHEDKYYSLVQSPQIYKQLLMYGGISKYFQIAKCYRDEDSRADRQLEFTQLDIEQSFTDENQIRETINKLLIKLTKQFRETEINNIPVMTYEEAMNRYGSDKPDTRFSNEISDLTEVLKETPVNFIAEGIKENKEVKAVFFEGDISNSDIKKLEELIKSQGANGLAWAKIGSKDVTGSLKSLSEENVNEIKRLMNISSEGVLFAIVDNKKDALEYIGRIRLEVANKLELINKEELSYLWVTEFPLFEMNNEGNIESMHNPFTSVIESDLETFRNISVTDKEKLLEIKSNAYDIVLNGTEIGGGAIRFSKVEDQAKAFELLGITQEEIEYNFAWFLEAQKYGIPQHGGIALGIDRLLSILLKKDTIRDVIAFPKTSSGTDEMMKAPIELK